MNRKTIAPRDNGERFLIYHPESDCVFECFGKKQRDEHLNNLCEDVTGIERYEKAFASTGKPPVEGGGAPLQVKYRPKTLRDVVGQNEVTAALGKVLHGGALQHSYLFTGPSGCGKTTLARIVAHSLGCEVGNIIETDAATNNGIDDMREITAALRYTGFGDSPNKMIIIDECHALSKAAWQSLLKSVEEPPPHVFFAFCTTDPGKVPDTIVTRCHSYSLRSVKYDDLMDLLESVVKQERMDPAKGVLELIARECNGSPRQALVMLSMTAACQDKEEAARLLEKPLEDAEVIDLCRALIKGDLSWNKLTSVLKAMPEQSPESIRIVVVNYLNSCIMGAKSDKEALRLLDLQAPFVKREFRPSDKLAPLLQAFGDLLFD